MHRKVDLTWRVTEIGHVSAGFHTSNSIFMLKIARTLIMGVSKCIILYHAGAT